MQISHLSSAAGDYALPPHPSVTVTAIGPVEHTDTGAGRPLLAIHGGLGGYDQSWLLARAILADLSDFRVLGVSRPGYLGTPQALARTPEAQADLYAALLDALGIKRTLVAAVSAGGPSAIQFALHHPQRCDGLILVSAASGRLETAPVFLARLRKMAWLGLVPGLVPMLRQRALRNPRGNARRAIGDLALTTRTLSHPQAGPLLMTVQRSSLTDLRRRLPGTRTDTAHYLTMPDPPLAQVTVPVLAIHGDADPVVPVRHARQVMDNVPNARGLILPGGGHAALFSHLDQVRETVAKFLAEQPN